MPGRTGGRGAELASDAAAQGQPSSSVHCASHYQYRWGPLGSTKVPGLLPEVDAFGVCSPDAVEFDDERLNVLASGARCVSLSSGRGVRTGRRDA